MVAVVVNRIGGHELRARVSDMYIDVTALAKAAGKKWSHYWQNDSTQEFIRALSSDAGIPASDLIQSRKGGAPGEQGTWAHRRVAIDFARWASGEFGAKVSGWVETLLTQGSVSLNPNATPAHEVDMLRGEMAQVSNRLDAVTVEVQGLAKALTEVVSALPGVMAKAMAEAMAQVRPALGPLAGTETVASRLGRLLPHWNTTAEQRATIRKRARANVRRALGHEPLCDYPGSQLEFPPNMHYHLDTAINQTYREACEANEVDDFGLYRDCDEAA